MSHELNQLGRISNDHDDRNNEDDSSHIHPHYGSIDPSSSHDEALPVLLTPEGSAPTRSTGSTSSMTEDDLDFYSMEGLGPMPFSSPNRRIRMRAFRIQTNLMSALSLLRHKYFDRALICTYFTLLFGTAPVGVWLFVQSSMFADLYLTYSRGVHIFVELINILIFYLFVSSAFNLHALFSAVGLNQLLGNVFVALCSGSILALECVDRVAVYMNEAHYDNRGFFVPSPSPPTDIDGSATVSVRNDGFTPNSTFLIIMLYTSLFSLMSAVVNALHLLYYSIEYRRAMNRAYQQIEDEEAYFFESER